MSEIRHAASASGALSYIATLHPARAKTMAQARPAPMMPIGSFIARLAMR